MEKMDLTGEEIEFLIKLVVKEYDKWELDKDWVEYYSEYLQYGRPIERIVELNVHCFLRMWEFISNKEIANMIFRYKSVIDYIQKKQILGRYRLAYLSIYKYHGSNSPNEVLDALFEPGEGELWFEQKEKMEEYENQFGDASLRV